MNTLEHGMNPGSGLIAGGIQSISNKTGSWMAGGLVVVVMVIVLSADIMSLSGSQV